MARARRRFGPLFYLTAIATLVVVASSPFWELGIAQVSAWRLSRRLHDPDEAVGRAAASDLMRLGPAVTWWVIRAMRDPDARVRVLAVSIVVDTAPENSEEPLTALVAAAQDSDPSVRAAAVGPLELLILRHGWWREPRVYDRALGAICASLADESPQVRWAAGHALFELGPLAHSAVDELDRALNSPDTSLRVIAARALAQIGPPAANAHVIAALRPLLADQSISWHHDILVQVLTSEQGEDETAAQLIPLLNHPDHAIRVQAVNDLIGNCTRAQATKPALIEALANDDRWVRAEAAFFVLRHVPSMASRAVDTLAGQVVELLAAEDGTYWGQVVVPRMRHASAGSLPRLAHVVLGSLARTKEPASRINAIRVLGELGPAAAPAVPALLDASKSADLKIATRAVEALVKIDPPSAQTRIPSLLEWMTAGHEADVRLHAMASLRDLGPTAKNAIPALLKLANHENGAISAGAIAAISQIESQ